MALLLLLKLHCNVVARGDRGTQRYIPTRMLSGNFVLNAPMHSCHRWLLIIVSFHSVNVTKKKVLSLVTLGLWAFLDFCKGYYIGSIHHVSCWHRSKWILINPMLPYILRRTSISRKISSLHIYWRADHGSIDNKCPMHFFKSSNLQQATSWKYLGSFKCMTVHSCNCHLFINCPNCTIITERSTLSTH